MVRLAEDSLTKKTIEFKFCIDWEQPDALFFGETNSWIKNSNIDQQQIRSLMKHTMIRSSKSIKKHLSQKPPNAQKYLRFWVKIEKTSKDIFLSHKSEAINRIVKYRIMKLQRNFLRVFFRTDPKPKRLCVVGDAKTSPESNRIVDYSSSCVRAWAEIPVVIELAGVVVEILHELEAVRDGVVPEEGVGDGATRPRKQPEDQFIKSNAKSWVSEIRFRNSEATSLRHR